MIGSLAYYARLFRSRLEQIAMRELYISEAGLILADEERADVQIVGSFEHCSDLAANDGLSRSFSSG